MVAMIFEVPRNLERHPIVGPAEVIPFTSPGSESICALCGGTGWRRVEGADAPAYRRCECIAARARAARLSVIPELFRGSTFES